MAITPGTRVIKRITDASTDSQSVTVASGQALLAAVWSNAYFLDTLATVSSVVQDPTGANLAFTAVASQAEWNSAERRLSLFVLEAPAVGTFNIHYTLSVAQARSEILIWPISGQDASAIVRASNTAQIGTPTSTELPIGVTSAVGDTIFYFGSTRTDAYQIVAGDLSNFSSAGVSSAYAVFSGTKDGAAGSVTSTATYNDVTDYSNALIAVSIKAAAVVPILSAPSISSVTDSSALAGFTTDTAISGALPAYFLRLPAATAAPANAAALIADGATVSQITGGTAPSRSMSGMAEGTAYKVHMCQPGSNVVSTASFTTLAVAPTIGSTTVIEATKATVNWTQTSANETGFQVQFETPSGANNWADASGATNPTAANATSFAATGLSAATEYRPRVRALQSGANSAWSTGSAFTTGATLAFSGTIPQQGGVQGTTFTRSGNATSTFFTTGYGTNTYSIGTGSLSGSGLSLNTSTGELSGTLNTPGTYAVTIRKTDSSGTPQVVDSNLFNIVITSNVDTTPPTLTGSVTPSAVAPSAATISWPSGSDNVAVAGYNYRLRIGAGAWSAYTNLANVLTTNLTGLTPSSVYNVEVVCRDSGGNVSTPAITGTFTTAAVGRITVPSIGPWTNSLLPSTLIENVMIIRISDRTVVLSLVSQTTDSSANLIIDHLSIITGTSYMVLAFNTDGSIRGAWPITAT